MHIYIILSVVSFRDRQHRAEIPRTHLFCTASKFSGKIIFHGADSLSAECCRVCPGSEWPPVLFLCRLSIYRNHKKPSFQFSKHKKAMYRQDTISKFDTWATCPSCHKRQFKIDTGAVIIGQIWQCRQCKNRFLIDTHTGSGLAKIPQK